MEQILLRPIRSEVEYQGVLASPVFGLFANVFPVFQSLYKHMQQYGALLSSLRYDSPNLADANVSCSLPELNAVIRLRMDRLEATFSTFHEVGAKIAHEILLNGWTAIHEMDASIELVEHRIFLSIYTQAHDTLYNAVMGRYMSAPAALGENSRAAVVFSLPEDADQGERQGHIVLGRFGGQGQGFLVRVNIVLDAKRIPFSDLAQKVEGYVARYLDHLGLALDQEEH